MDDLWHWQFKHSHFQRSFTRLYDTGNQTFSSSTSFPSSYPRQFLKPSRNVLDVLKKRETGLGIDYFEDQVVFERTANLQCVKAFLHVNTDADVEFLKEGRASDGQSSIMIGWCSREQTLVEERYLEIPPVTDAESSFKWQYPNSYKTVDISTYCYKVLILIMSNSVSCRASFVSKSDGNVILDCDFLAHIPVHCCTANDFTKKFAYGMTKIIFVDVPGQSTARTKDKVIKVKGMARSVEFDQIGSVIYAGFDTGDVGLLDLRSKEVIYHKILDKGLDETILLSDDNQLICGGDDGMLCSLDLRMRRPLFHFIGHKHTGERKVPFSLDEFNHIICATGDDNITRLWNLKTGLPLTYIEPPVAGSPCRAWLASNGYKFYLHLYQKSKSYIFENL